LALVIDLDSAACAGIADGLGGELLLKVKAFPPAPPSVLSGAAAVEDAVAEASIRFRSPR